MIEFFRSKKEKTINDLDFTPEKTRLLERENAHNYAKELRETTKGEFYQKLLQIGTAFTLAGITLFANPFDKAYAPGMSKEMMGTQNMEAVRENNPSLYKEILKQMKEMGGVIASEQLPETVYRPSSLTQEITDFSFESEEAFYNQPEIILGKKFLKEHPQESKEYLEKIKLAMERSVRLENPAGIGSGAIVEYKNEKYIITNNHVVEFTQKKGRSMRVIFADKTQINLWVTAVDPDRDIAILKIPSAGPNYKKLKAFTFDEDEIKPGEKIGSIGNPLGFPFVASISQTVDIKSAFKNKNIVFKTFNIEDSIFYVADKRFKNLALYDPKKIDDGAVEYEGPGESMHGMSGGPLFKLNTKDEPKLFGINRARFTQGNTDYFKELGIKVEKGTGIAVSAKTLLKFFQDQDNYQKQRGSNHEISATHT